MAVEPSTRLRSQLHPGEELAWVARPRKAPFAIYHAYGFALVGLIFAPVLVFFAFLSGPLGLAQRYGVVVSTATAALFLGTLVLSAYATYTHAEYAATDDRIIRAGFGIVGRNLSVVSWTDVQEFEVNVGLFDRLFGTGTIEVVVGSLDEDAGVTFRFVRNPYVAAEELTAANGSSGS